MTQITHSEKMKLAAAYGFTWHAQEPLPNTAVRRRSTCPRCNRRLHVDSSADVDYGACWQHGSIYRVINTPILSLDEGERMEAQFLRRRLRASQENEWDASDA
jgi:hypothetical protein